MVSYRRANPPVLGVLSRKRQPESWTTGRGPAGASGSARRDAAQLTVVSGRIINKLRKLQIGRDSYFPYPHSIVNSRAQLRGKVPRARGSNRPDTDKSTVALEGSSCRPTYPTSSVDGSKRGSESKFGMFRIEMTVSTDRYEAQ